MLTKVIPGMIMGGSPYMFLPGKSGISEKIGSIDVITGSYNQGKLPCASYCRYKIALKRMSGNENFHSLYQCLGVHFTTQNTLSGSGDPKEEYLYIYIPAHYLVGFQTLPDDEYISLR